MLVQEKNFNVEHAAHVDILDFNYLRRQHLALPYHLIQASFLHLQRVDTSVC